MSITLAELSRRTGAELHGDGSVLITRVATLDAAAPDAIAFLANPRYRAQLASTHAGAVIVAPHMASHTGLPKLVSRNPYAVFAKVANALHPAPRATPGVHPSAIISTSARIAPTADIAARAVIGERVELGDGVHVGAGCVIEDDVRIGEDSWLYPNVTIYPRCVIGRRAIVHSGAVIGSDGFGMAEESGRWIKIPQTGRVVVGDDVEIGANTTIDRGAIEDTVIEDDVKLDNQIQIGHNCRIGAHTAIAGCVGIAGSTTIERNCRVGGAAMIAGHLTIGEGVTISGATQVFESIAGPGVYSGLFPPLPHREWVRVASAIRRLAKLDPRLRALEASVSRVRSGSSADAPREGEKT
ncbi:MAG: UDP-3-O-(3-hydroxymyristoyl)glucosamine N-acyltransferase [Pseudomonadota bacterium]|nr:UDP-3-O-(3-hydroxymyristoyl)glucosamine N-acyltransferase [Pseudomonadota bacterium]